MKALAYKWQVMSVVIFGSFMVILDSTVVNVTVPTFEQVFKSDVNGVQWILTSYLLALGIITPVAGYLADNFGIKRMYLLSLGLFVLGSALCGFSQSLPMLVIFRVLQGLGGGATVPLGTAQLFSAFPPEERGLANGIFGVPLLVAPALGPTLGGYIVQYFHWSLIFYINVPIGLAGIGMGLWLLHSDETHKSRKFDYAGFGLAAAGLGLLLYALSEVSNQGWGDPLILTLFGVSLVFLITFAVVELRREDAIVDLRLYKQHVFTLGSIVYWVMTIALFGTAFLLPLYLQNIRGKSPFETGLLLLPQAVAAAVTVPFTGRLFDKVGPRALVTFGIILLAGSSWFFTQISPTSDILTIEILLAVRGLALGFALQSTFTTALSVVERRALPRGSSLVNASRQVFQALGIAVLSTILTTQTTAYMNAARGQNISPQQAGSEAFVSGLNDAFNMVFWMTVAGVILSIFLPGWPGKWPLKKPDEKAYKPGEAGKSPSKTPESSEQPGSPVIPPSKPGIETGKSS
ncbi:MAG TPA: MDR family MFS transporter [Chloroflexia bacterium]|nr:MDR family MFS transporter [Chloroflexia bacterium]